MSLENDWLLGRAVNYLVTISKLCTMLNQSRLPEALFILEDPGRQGLWCVLHSAQWGFGNAKQSQWDSGPTQSTGRGTMSLIPRLPQPPASRLPAVRCRWLTVPAALF